MSKKILIIQNKFLGDVLVASTLCEALKSIDNDFVIEFFCYSNAVPLIENNLNINEIIHCKEIELKNISTLLKYAYKIYKKKYDIVIDPYSKIQSQLFTIFSGAKKTVSYNTGYKKLIYSNTIPIKSFATFASCSAVEDKLELIKELFPEYKLKEVPYKISITSQQKKHGLELLKNIPSINLDLPIIMIGIQGSNESKSYPWKYMATLIESVLQIYSNRLTIIFNYTPNQSDIAKNIYNFLNQPRNLYPQLIGESLTDMLSVLSHCRIVIGCEGGLIHMAKALNIPTFNIYSPLISRESWGVLENLEQNESVHLVDFKPELFSKSYQDINELKTQFFPNLIIPKLISFLSKFL